MKRLTLIIGLIVVLSRVSSIFAAPIISNITGSVDDGNTISLSGLSFGANSAVGTGDLQWLGDNIDAGVDGAAFSASSWSNKVTVSNSETAAAVYTSTQAHSNNQSILIDYSAAYSGHIQHSHRTPLDKVYFTYWIRLNWGGVCRTTNCQWKVWRLVNGSSINGRPMAYQNSWTSGMREIVVIEDTSNDTKIHLSGGLLGSTYLGRRESPGTDNSLDTWVRMEYYAVQSGIGQTDGTLEYWYHYPGANIIKPIDHVGNIMTRNIPKKWDNIILGTYGSHNGLKVYWDDIFVQVGTQARVEIGDASTWSACTHREIQIPTAWSDSSITINAQQGSFVNGDNAYLYVVDSNGNVSSGYPITFSGADTTPPNPPTGLTIQ